MLEVDFKCYKNCIILHAKLANRSFLFRRPILAFELHDKIGEDGYGQTRLIGALLCGKIRINVCGWPKILLGRYFCIAPITLFARQSQNFNSPKSGFSCQRLFGGCLGVEITQTEWG